MWGQWNEFFLKASYFIMFVFVSFCTEVHTWESRQLESLFSSDALQLAPLPTVLMILTFFFKERCSKGECRLFDI